MARKKSSEVPLARRLPAGYADILESLKSRVQQSQTKAMLSVNRELIQLYWDIGRVIVERQEQEGWGKGIVDRLAADVQKAFPGLGGFSPMNVWRMRAFYMAYRPAPSILSQAVTELTDKKAAQSGRKSISRKLAQPVRELKVAQKLAQAVTNFERRLPAPQSDLAQQSLKDPYLFDFLTLQDDAIERNLEDGLLGHVRKFLLELGAGFAFVGQQMPVAVGDAEYYLDLLFYHLQLRCFVVIDLKMKAFTPEDAGKMNFYLSAVDDRMRHASDAPTIGLILCKTRDRVIAEYALRDIAKPIGVAAWQTKLVKSLPKSLRGTLPSIQDIEAELAAEASS